MTAAGPTSEIRDDRLLPITRVLAYVFVPVLSIAFLILYVTPTRTDDVWAWTIRPDMTPVVMGAGYLAGAGVFAAGLYFGQWHRLSWALVGTVIFSVMMIAATFIHWDRFNHDHPAFWVWLALYVGTPFMATYLWAMNRRTDPGRRPDDPITPAGIRYAFALGGAVDLGVAIAMFIDPDLAIDAWPWALTPLTARVLAAFVAFVGVVWLCMLLDDRWTSFSLIMGATVFGLALIGIGALGRTDEFSGGAETALFVVSLFGTLAAVGGLLLYMRPPRAQLRSALAAS
jgi:hypothetical protein